MKKLKWLVTSYIAAALVSLTHAGEDSRGLYVSAVGSADSAQQGKSLVKLLKGRSASLACGFGFKNSVRVEAEFGYHTFKNNRFFPPAALGIRGWTGIDNGKSNHLSLMTNVCYDLTLNERWEVNFGLGAGAMRFSGERIYMAIDVINPPVSYNEIDRLAAQILGGVTFHVTPRLALTAGYRLAEAASASFQNQPINTGLFRSIEFGLRIKL